MNIEKELADLQENILKITSLYGTTGNNQKRELQTSFNKVKAAIFVTRCCEELKDKKKLNYEEWKFNQGLRYMSDFTYKNAKGKLFESEDLVKMYEAYKNL